MRCINLVLIEAEYSIAQYIERNGDLIRIYVLQNGDKWGLFTQHYILSILREDDESEELIHVPKDDDESEEVINVPEEEITRFGTIIDYSDNVDVTKYIDTIWNFVTHSELHQLIINDLRKHKSYLCDCIFESYKMRRLSKLFAFVLLINSEFYCIEPTKDMLQINQPLSAFTHRFSITNTIIDLFCFIDIVKLKERKAREKLENIKRFFRILIALPSDLQMVMINRMFRISRDSIPSTVIENGLCMLRDSGFFN
jgi:hypothetical protein